MKPEPRKNISDRMGINVARVPHSGLQQDAAGTSEGNEDNANDDIDDLYNLLFGQDSELENQDTSNPVAQQVGYFKLHSCLHVTICLSCYSLASGVE